MPQNARQQQIIDLVRQRGFVSIEALAEHFAVTPQTVRRDINQLCERELLRRYHGGAGLPSSVENVAYKTRQILFHEEKRRIAQLAARHIPDGASLFINIGTTTEEVAVALLEHSHLRVITNNLHVASILSENDRFEVIVAGGELRSRDRGIIGMATVDFISQRRRRLAARFRSPRGAGVAGDHRQFEAGLPSRRPQQVRPQSDGPAGQPGGARRLLHRRTAAAGHRRPPQRERRPAVHCR